MPEAPIPVLYVIATLDCAGAEHQLTLLATCLDRRRFAPKVVCLTRGGPFEERLAAAGVPCAVLGKRHKWDLRAVAALKAVIRDHRARVVHTWLFTGNAYGRWAAHAARVPAIIASERSVDDWRSWRHRMIDRRLARHTAAIVANCRAVREFVVGEGIDPAKVRVIENAIDLEAFDAAVCDGPRDAVLDDLTDRFVLIQVGRLEPQKGVPDLLAAADLLRRSAPELMLVLVGDGPDRPGIEREIAARGLEAHVRLLGRRDDVPPLLAHADAVVLASRWEGLPNVVIEAMAARRPVVVTDVGGCAELVTDGRTGFVVPPAEPERLARAIETIRDDPALGLELGSAARENVEQRFTVERMVNAYQDLYLECLAETDGTKQECPG
jgi:glycosyltransferase involved in cell wall biosynthesis